MATVNRVLWQDGVGIPGTIRERPVPTNEELDDRQILVRVHAWALNPCDSMLQTVSLPFVKYPVILGQDIAGIVEAVGATAASKFSIGDRIFAFTGGNNGFQEYVPLDCSLAAKIPGELSYREACIFGLCITTSSFSLFGKDFLNLEFPNLGATTKGKTVLIWGGSSAAGSNAIQMAVGAGYDVLTTCSPQNFEYVKSLGASEVFDRSSPTVTEDIVAKLGDCAGIYMAAGSNAAACKVSAASKENLLVVSSNPFAPEDVPEGVEAKFTFGSGIGPEAFSETLPATFGGYLTEALAKGIYKIAPPPRAVNSRGLDGIQEALDILKPGVSATKLVVERP